MMTKMKKGGSSAVKSSPKLRSKVVKKKMKFMTEKRDVRDIKVKSNKLLTTEEIDAQLDAELENDTSLEPNVEAKQRRSGVVYLSSIPPRYNAQRLRQQLGGMAKIGRIHLVRHKKFVKDQKYKEGWIEFESKRKAKTVVEMLSGHIVGGKTFDLARDTMWSCKYLHGFKWVHLMEQLNYEKKVEEHRMRVEMGMVKRQAEFFAESVEKGSALRKLEEKVLRKGGLWEKYCRQVDQKRPKKADESTQQDVMKLIFDKED